MHMYMHTHYIQPHSIKRSNFTVRVPTNQQSFPITESEALHMCDTSVYSNVYALHS